MVCQSCLQEYRSKYEEQKRLHKEKVEEFLSGLGGKEQQDAYLTSLAEYKAKRRAYLKKFRLKKLGLIKVCLRVHLLDITAAMCVCVSVGVYERGWFV